VIIVDECQNITFKELVTTITRLGEFSKIIFLGDPYQSDLPPNKSGGFSKMCKMFSGEDSQEHGVYHFKFTKEDIVRSEFVKFVVNKLETYDQPHEMFPSN
jgi:phosphate starvation-inducible protein PhoH